MKEIDLAQVMRFMVWGHDGQRRKHSGEKYHVHPARVSAMAAVTFGADGVAAQAAAALHDLVEDQPAKVSFELIEMLFGPVVRHLVYEVTNEKVAGLPREQQKAKDRAKLAKASQPARIIKLLDRRDNINDVIACIHRGTCHEFDWARTYADETNLLIPLLEDAHVGLAQKLTDDTQYLIRVVDKYRPALPAPTEPQAPEVTHE
jgi:(p)ppGpp synthase/HD superfamily hydrolase